MTSSGSTVFELIEFGEDRVIKRFPDGTGLGAVEHEVEMTMLARRYGLETPFVHGVVEHSGGLGISYDKVLGPTFTRWMIEHPSWLMRLIEFFVHEHHEIHMHKVPELPRLKDAVGVALASTAGIGDEERDGLTRRLARMPDGDWMCHMCFVPDTIIVSIDGPVIFNWGGAVRGDYLADVAMTSILLERWEPRPEDVEADPFMEVFRHGYELEYLKTCGRSQGELDAWRELLLRALPSLKTGPREGGPGRQSLAGQASSHNI